MIRIGIDLGGTKTEIVALKNTEILFSKRVNSPRNSYQDTLSTIVSLVSECEKAIGQQIDSIGIGTPGSVSKATGTLKNSNSVWLNGMPIHRDLEKQLGRKIQIANDADCFTLSEATDGAAKIYHSVFGVIIGTGTGGGIVVNKSLLNGPNGITGEWGHNPLPWPLEDEIPGADCYCGKQGCIETFLSGPGMAREFNSLTNNAIEPPQILDLAKNGNKEAIEAMDKYYERLAKALAHMINILDPDAIVLGGGMSNIEQIYNEVPKRWGKYVFSDSCETNLLKAKFGDASGVRGAAWL